MARTLRAKFFKYLNRDEDYNQVLKHILRKMARDKVSGAAFTVAGEVHEDGAGHFGRGAN